MKFSDLPLVVRLVGLVPMFAAFTCDAEKNTAKTVSKTNSVLGAFFMSLELLTGNVLLEFPDAPAKSDKSDHDDKHDGDVLGEHRTNTVGDYIDLTGSSARRVLRVRH